MQRQLLTAGGLPSFVELQVAPQTLAASVEFPDLSANQHTQQGYQQKRDEEHLSQVSFGGLAEPVCNKDSSLAVPNN